MDVEKMEKKKDVKGLIKALNHNDSTIKQKAAKALANIGDKRAIEPLIQSLKDNNVWLQKNASLALGKIGDRRAVEPLIQAYMDGEGPRPGWGIRASVVAALGDLRDKKAVDLLIKTLDCEEILDGTKYYDSASDTRRNAAEALGKIGDARAVAPLIQALKDDHSEVREKAKEALIKIGISAIEPLFQGLKDAVAIVRLNVADVLDQLGWKPINDVEKAYYLIAQKKWEDLLELGQVIMEPLIQTPLRDENEEIQRRVVETFIRIGEPVVNPLIQALKENHWTVRLGAAEVLGSLRVARAVPSLIEAYETKGFYVNGYPKVTIKQEKLLYHGISKALMRIGEPSIEPLIKALDFVDMHKFAHEIHIREGVLHALKMISDPRTVGPLIEAMKREINVNLKLATEALINIGEPSVEPLLRVFNEYNSKSVKDKIIRKAAAEALGGIGDDRALEPLTNALNAEYEDFIGPLNLLKKKLMLKNVIISAKKEYKDKKPLELRIFRVKDIALIQKILQSLEISQIQTSDFLVVGEYVDHYHVCFFTCEGLMLGAENCEKTFKFEQTLRESTFFVNKILMD